MSQPTVSQPRSSRDWVPIIITALTGLLGTGIIVTIFNFFISSFYAPDVQVLIKPNYEQHGNNSSVLMVNHGGAAAGDVKLTVKTPKEIKKIENFSTESISLKQVNSTLLEGNMKRFVQGNGSLVNIKIIIKRIPNINYTKDYTKNITAFVTYDQGSNIGRYWLESHQYDKYIYYLIIYIAAFIAAIFSFRRLIYRRRLRRLKRRLLIITQLSEEKTIPPDTVLMELNLLRRLVNDYHTEGKLHKADYDGLGKEIKELKNSIGINMRTRYTSEGKQIITDEK